MHDHKQLLERFLNIPVSCSDEIFAMFSELPGAQYECGGEPLQRYVYVPGKRKDRVLLVAHADTVWDREYVAVAEHAVVYHDGVFSGGISNTGIGADDRAGCAMVWALRDSGHSLLITDGEEHGLRGTRYIEKHRKKLLRELNRHRYILEMDWRDAGTCLFNGVDVTEKFVEAVEQMGFRALNAKGQCDLKVLCKRICGANVGIGYKNIHGPGEQLILSQWEETYAALEKYLQLPQRRFSVSIIKRLKKRWMWCKALPRRAMRKAKRILFSERDNSRPLEK